MLASSSDRNPRFVRLVLSLAAIALLLAASPLRAQIVANYTFEDGGADGWASFFGASTPANTTADAHSGTHSLLTSTSSTGTGGPSVNLTGVLEAGAQYTITGWVKLVSTDNPTTANLNFTIKRSDPSPACSGGTCFDTIGAFTTGVTTGGWTQIGGSYTVSSTETALLLYAQTVGLTTSEAFYLDDVVITETAPPPGGTPVATYNWSDGALDGWAPFGTPTLAVAMPSPVDPIGNAHALLTTNRTATYMGPSLDLLSVNGVVAGATYEISAYVMLAQADSANPTVTMSTKTANCATSGAFANIATSGPLSNTAWTKVSGTFNFSDLPGPPSSLTLYFQSSSATDSFYISNVAIGQLTPAPVPPSQQDNTGITTTFADGTADGWTSRAGSTLSVVPSPTPDPNNDASALLIANRTHNYDGPQISVNNKMYTGSIYNLSVYVMMQPQDALSHIVNMSLQITYQGNTSFPSITSYPGITVPDDGQWHQIVVNNFPMGSNYDPDKAFVYLQTVTSDGSNDLTGFYIADFQLTYVPPPTIQTNIPSIAQTFANDFPIGTAVDTNDLSGPHAQLLTMHFNSITSGNDFKWSVTEPSKGSYDWTNADAEAGEAVCHDMKIRGHNLVWANGSQVPSYAFGDGTNSPANQATVTANIQEHIQAELQHFGTEAYAWDVVNEPIDPTQSDCLVHGPFYNVLGQSYIDIAFQEARKDAPPGTKLFLNQYSTADPNMLACLVKVVQGMRARGVPIDGIGHENHNAINYPPVSAIKTAIDTVAQQLPGLDQQVTELDESVYNTGDLSNYGNNVPPALLDAQGWLYNQYFNLFRLERHRLTGVTLWGMADDDTWLDGFPVARTDYPLPFNMGLQAKPAYWGIVNPDGNGVPGYGLKFALTHVSGSRTSQTWTITATNGNVGPAYTTQITGLTLTQVLGPACSATITPPGGAFPVALGDIPTSGTATAQFTVTFKGCGPLSAFIVQAPWTQAIYHTGTLLGVADPALGIAF